MHLEVISDTPGKCPKCGMDLVLKSELVPKIVNATENKGLGTLTWQSYMPLVIILLLILATSLTSSFGAGFSLQGLLLNFMTGFFLVFSGFKLLDLKGFANGYATYDLLAIRVKAYGYVYPFIELSFGLLMLYGYHFTWLLWTEFAVMMFSGLGVAIKIAKKEPFICACLGTFLKVPLTYVTLVEDFGMALLALGLLALM